MRRTAIITLVVLATVLVGATAAYAANGCKAPSAGQEWIVSGKVASVDHTTNTVSLMNTSTVVRFSEDTTIYGARERTYITPTDMCRFDIVHVAGTRTATGEVEATWINVIHPAMMVTGKIIAIDKDAQTITLYKNKRWPRVVVNYDDRTRVRVPGKYGVRTVNILDVGMRVKTHGYRKGMEIHTSWIKVLRYRSRKWSGNTVRAKGKK